MKNSKKIITITIASLSIMMMFAGCSPKKTGNYIMNPGSNATNPKISSPTSIKMIYSNTLSSLVKAKTITKAQANKVFAEVNKNSQTSTTNGMVNPNQVNNGIGAPPTNSGTGMNGTGTTGMYGKGTTGMDGSATNEIKGIGTVGMDGMINLNGLVKKGVITQKQAKMINQRVVEAIKNNQIK